MPMMNPLALSSRRREEGEKVGAGSFALQVRFLVKSSWVIAVAQSRWMTSSIWGAKECSGRREKVLKSSWLGMVLSVPRIQAVAGGGSLTNLRNAWRKLLAWAKKTPEVAQSLHTTLYSCSCGLWTWASVQCCVFPSLSAADHRNRWRRRRPASQPGLAFQPPQASHVPNRPPHSVSSLAYLARCPQTCE